MVGTIVELDVREDVQKKIEPFEKIMNAIKPLQAGDTFILHAPFKPIPLLPIMKAKGFTYKAEQAIALILHGAAFILPFFGDHRQIAIVIYGYLLGWIMLSIIGYLYKIVPFLWWTHRYSKKIGKENVPTLKQMVHENWAAVQCALFTISAIGVTIALAVSNLPLFYIAQGAMTLFSLLFVGTVISVLRK